MTTVVVFVPLAFIQGLVGAFFLPFALTVSFALLASLLVALTAVPVLGALLLRPGDLPDGAGDEGDLHFQETWLQRTYLTILRWVLGHRVVTLLSAALLTAGSLGLLILVIPVNLFGGGGDRSLQIVLNLPPGSGVEQTVASVTEIESRLGDLSEVYSASIGGTDFGPGAGGSAGLQQARFVAQLSEDAPEDIAETLRKELDKPGQTLRVSEISAGPPAGGVEIAVTGPNYDDIAAVTRILAAEIEGIEGIVNLETEVAQARPEVAVEVDPERAARIGLTTRQVGLQLSQFLIGQRVTTINVEGESVDVVLSGDPRATAGVEQLKSLTIVGPGGAVPPQRGRGTRAPRGTREHQPHGRPAVRQHHRCHRRRRHPGRGHSGRREDRSAGPAARRQRHQRRHLRRHRRGLPGQFHIHGCRHCAGLSGHGRQPW